MGSTLIQGFIVTLTIRFQMESQLRDGELYKYQENWRGETMGLWIVQTWTVSKGKLEEHEEIMRKMQKFNREHPEFEDMADYENFFAIRR